jgi:microcompartment protein CcmL/EutN
VAADTLLDQLLIPQVHPMVLAAARGTVPRGDGDDALGVIETLTASAAIVAADFAAKAARVTLRDLRLANGIGGKGVLYLTGEVGEVEAAVAAGRDEARRRGLLARAVVIPRLHAQMKERIR